MQDNLKTAVLIHGKDGSPTTSWLPWLKHELENESFRCIAPTFPPQDDSKLQDWFAVLNDLTLDLPHTIFIAHARGAMALLRWINTLPGTAHIHQIITLSCNFDYQPNRTDGDEFYITPLNYADLKLKCRHFTVIHSEDDQYVPIVAGEQLATNLAAKFVRYKTAGHFGSAKTEAPEILREIIAP
jgi:predicted alpha/beta hydrolase family esterase